ncbi:MAG: 2-C-methyl-D-erythritol 4-phosphate cytidylyltransferase [Candidatus Cloacimonetes bacterium]|nr:2-C-methyl-D-erythritol 4-phosphate cytidylyltransferase [Candidatus Cloacimonadota bacterium]
MKNIKLYKNVAIITAGGSGLRLSKSQKKQFIMINGRSILFRTIDTFSKLEEIQSIIVTLPKEELKYFKENIENEFHKVKIICGGKERNDSVYQALLQCPPNTDYVLIHDGVRPFVASNDIKKMLNLVIDKKALIPVSKVKYTLKLIENKKIVKTVPREKIYNAHTPQIFEYKLIFDCHKKLNNSLEKFTDDASLLEYFGIEVSTYEINDGNFKITDQYDLKIAKLLINSGENI